VKIPHVVAAFAIAFMIDHAEDDPQMEQDGGEDELSGHLRVVDSQRAASRAMNGLAEDGRRTCLQQFACIPEMNFSHLDAIGDLRRPQEEKIAEELVVIVSGGEAIVPEERFERPPGLLAFKHRQIAPRILSPTVHINRSPTAG